MSMITVADDAIQIDADVLAKAFRIDVDELKKGMRESTITSRFERGEEEDAGRMRLTFFSARRQVRITAEESGRILTCSAVDFGDRPLPHSARKAG